MYIVRLRGIGRTMLSVSEEKGVHLLMMRDNSKEDYTWEQLMESLHTIMLPDRTAEESWTEFYNEEFPEKDAAVAPVQQTAPRKETKVVKAKLPEKEETKKQEENKKEKTQEVTVQQAEEPEEQQAEESEEQQAPELENQEQEPETKQEKESEEQQAEDAKVQQALETRRTAHIAELEAKVHFWADSIMAHEIALKNRISMNTWDKVAELALQIKEEAEKILDLQREIKEVKEAVQMRIEDMETQDLEEQDAEEND